MTEKFNEDWLKIAWICKFIITENKWYYLNLLFGKPSLVPYYGLSEDEVRQIFNYFNVLHRDKDVKDDYNGYIQGTESRRQYLQRLVSIQYSLVQSVFQLFDLQVVPDDFRTIVFMTKLPAVRRCERLLGSTTSAFKTWFFFTERCEQFSFTVLHWLNIKIQSKTCLLYTSRCV